MAKQPRKPSLVTLKKAWAKDPAQREAEYIHALPLVYLGEIPKLPEHGVFASAASGRILAGRHIGQFRELGPAEV